MSGVMDLYLIYEFLKRLVRPFDKWEAYKKGVIDRNGDVIVAEKDRTREQKKAWGYYDRLIANLKKLLGKIPGGKTRIASFAAALLLLRENNLDPDDMEHLSEIFNEYMQEAEILIEELPTNSAAGGLIAGIGIGPDGEPGFSKKQIEKHKKEISQKKREIVDTIKRMKQ